ncbi:MAG: hypothetical protein ACUVQD_01765 [Thermaceae bacterium]
MKGVDNLWITLWITRGVPVDNPVDNLWITPPFSTPVDNWGGFSTGYPQGDATYPQELSTGSFGSWTVFSPIYPHIHRPYYYDYYVFNSLKKKNSSSNRRRWRKKWKSN